jgi:hypothetical protein
MADQYGRNANTMRMQDYTQQLQLGESDIGRRFGAAMNAPTLANQTLQNSQNLFNLGTSAQNQPFDKLKNYQGLISGGFGGTTNTPIYENKMAGLLGGAGAGASIYKNIFGSN